MDGGGNNKWVKITSRRNGGEVSRYDSLQANRDRWTGGRQKKTVIGARVSIIPKHEWTLMCYIPDSYKTECGRGQVRFRIITISIPFISKGHMF